MHDCPTCQVPLHGYEEYCPSCGTKQHIRKEYRDLAKLPPPPGVNWMPFVIGIIGFVIVFIVAAQTTWIGQVFTRGQVKEDPLDKLTTQQARQIIETKLNEGLTTYGGKAKLSWMVDGKPADKAADVPMNLNVDAQLKNPNDHKAIVDPIKDYMDKAKIPSLTMTDAKSHATWTYTVSLSAPQSNDADSSNPAPSQ
jgi:hypothetical protein